MPREIQVIKFDSETISPEKYLKLSENEKMNISQAKIVPPQLGQKDFGKIQIIYKSPIFKTEK
jgi:hypothetical protein